MRFASQGDTRKTSTRVHDSDATSEQRPPFAERRADVLSELVRIFAQGKEPAELVETAVNLVAKATGGKSVFVYFWEPESERLVLRTMTQADQGYSENRIEMRLGEGITGWSALHRKPVLLNEGFQDDPRFLVINDVNEDEFSSVLVTPIYDDETLFGVFSMYSGEKNAFSDEELAIAEEVGLLLASGLKRAQTVRELELQSATARFLIDLPTVSGVSFASAARESASRILTLLDADACIIDYVGWMSVVTEPIAVAERVEGSAHPKVWLSHSRHQARETEQRYTSAGCDQISASLGYGISRGILTCFRSRRFTKEEAHRLTMLATQVGMLIENIGFTPNLAAQTMSLLASDREDQMLESLTYLGWKKNAFVPALLQVNRMGVDVESFGKVIQSSAIEKLGPETLLAHSGTLIVALVQAENATAEAAAQAKISSWLEHLVQSTGLRAEVGIGPGTIRTNSIRSSLLNARLALAWAGFSSARNNPLQVVEFDSIDSMRNLPGVVSELSNEVRECYALLRPLQAYDREHDSQLLETLHAFALYGGVVVDAADSLFIHRNTLRQRLERIASLTNENFAEEHRWPELLLAARLLMRENAA